MSNKFRDFSEMPDDKLRALAEMKRIRDARRTHNNMLVDRVKGMPAQPDDGTQAGDHLTKLRLKEPVDRREPQYGKAASPYRISINNQ